MAFNINPDQLLHAYGHVAVLVGPMLESTGIPFPGETLLVAGAVYAATSGQLSIPVVILCGAGGAILGDNFGYLIGRWLGRRLLERVGGVIHLTPERLSLMDRFFARRGPLAVVIARFVIVLRSFTALFAGAARMPYRLFLPFNALGGAAWATAYGLIGFELGHAYQKLQGTIGAVAVVGAVVVVAALLLLTVLARKRLLRWAVGDQARGSEV